MPEYEKITFENGFRLLLSEDSRAKSCSMGVWVGSGSCYESDDTAGISHFIEHMVFKGSAMYSSEDIASISDRMGVFNFSSGDYTIKCSPTWKTKSLLWRRETSSCSFSGRYGALVAQRLSWPMW